jgi:Zn-finger protein
MVYCSNCGAELRSSKIFCPECRFRHNPTQIDKLARKARMKGFRPPVREERSQPSRKEEESAAPEPEVYEARRAAHTFKEDVQERPGQKVHVLKEGCGYCERNADRRCFFCYTPLCDYHTDALKIFVRNNPFGKTIRSCSDCASERQGQTPTQQEAEKANMFFNVKPYHEWRRVKGR